MALRDILGTRFGKAYINIGKRLFGLGKDPNQLFQVMGQSYDSRRKSQDLNTYEGVVFACVSVIGEGVGEYNPVFQYLKGDNYETIPDHPFLRLLQNPQSADPSGITMYDLFEATQSFIDLQGECFWYLPYGEKTKQPKEIHILRSDKMGISVDDQGEIDGYYLKRDGGNPIPFTVEEIMQFKRFNPHNAYHGMSLIEAGIDYIETEESISKFTKNFFKNNAGLSGVLTIKGEVSRNAFKTFARQWRERYQGVDNAGKVAIVRDSESEFTKVGLGLNELDMEALKKMTKDDVFMMFRTPKGLFGLSDDTGLGRASVETLEYIFAKRALEPKMKKLDSMIHKAAVKYFPDIKVDRVTHTNVVPADKEFELSYQDKAVDRWLTRDEIRDKDGLDAQPGGDELYVELNKVPLGEPAPETAAAAPKKLSFKVIRPKAKGVDELDYERKEAFRLKLQQNKNAYAKKYKTKFSSTLQAQKEIVLANINNWGKDIASQLFDISDANGEFDKAMYPVLRSMSLQQGALALVFAGDSETEFDITSSLEAALHSNTLRMAGNFNKETLDALAKTLTQGIQDGESLNKLKGRVEDVYSEAEGWRAERIARTESSFATGDATLDAYRQTGYVVGKQWFANPGACEFCAELDGTSIGLEDTFVEVGGSVDGTEGGTYDVTYDSVESAELHPNCNCTIIPVREFQESVKHDHKDSEMLKYVKELEELVGLE